MNQAEILTLCHWIMWDYHELPATISSKSKGSVMLAEHVKHFDFFQAGETLFSSSLKQYPLTATIPLFLQESLGSLCSGLWYVVIIWSDQWCECERCGEAPAKTSPSHHGSQKIAWQIVIRFGAFRKKCNVFRDFWFLGRRFWPRSCQLKASTRHRWTGVIRRQISSSFQVISL